MPAGVSMKQYITALGVSLITMFAGSQFVHVRYRPLDKHDVTKVPSKRREATLDLKRMEQKILLDLREQIEEEKVKIREEYKLYTEKKTWKGDGIDT